MFMHNVEKPRKEKRTLLVNLRSLLPFEQLARNGDFESIAKVLQDDHIDTTTLEKWLNKKCIGSETPLHRLVRYRPPASLVDLLARKLAVLRNGDDKAMASEHFGTAHDLSTSLSFIAEESRDTQGRTPLHIAVAMQCHMSVIKRLVAGPTCTNPVFVLDEEGRCPLHWACTKVQRPLILTRSRSGPTYSCLPKNPYSKQRSQVDKLLPSQENSIDVVHLLVRMYREAACIRDIYGNTPSDLAKNEGMNGAIVSLLEEAAASCRKEIVSGITKTANVSTMHIEMPENWMEEDDISSLGSIDDEYNPWADLKGQGSTAIFVRRFSFWLDLLTVIYSHFFIKGILKIQCSYLYS